MIRFASLGFLTILLAGLGACASEAPSGSATSPPPGRLDPVNEFPQSRGGNSYMRQ